MARRFLAAFLSLVMVFSFTVSAYAEGTVIDDNIVIENTEPTIITEPDGDGFNVYEFDDVYDVGDDTEVTTCADCGNEPCTCEKETASVCETCGSEPCTCEPDAEPQICEVCNADPCVCEEEATVCDTCGQEPCICVAEEPAVSCETCGADPCTCEQVAPVCPGDDTCTIEGCQNHNPPAPAQSCEECGLTEGHAETCSQYEAPAPAACEECGQTEGHAEECSLYVDSLPQSEIYDTLMAAESVEDMYIVLLGFMDSDPDGLFELSSEELQEIYDYAAELNADAPPEDYADLCDTLQYIAGEYELLAVALGSGTMTGTEFLDARDSSNTVKLTGDTTITSRIMINANETLIIDLNGYVLISNVQNGHSLLHCYGTLTIKSSNSAREHNGTMVPVTRWIDKRTNYSTYGSEYNVDSSNHFYDRYIRVTTADNELWKYDQTGSTVVEGGVITGAFKYGSGSAIYLDGGTLNILSGTIAGNSSMRNVVYDESKENKLEKNPNNPFGGAVYATGSNAVINMSGGTISYNWGDYYGGAVCIANGSTMNMTSGVITDNCAQGSGGGIGVRDDSVLNLGTDKSVTYNSVAAPVISYNRTFDVNYTGGGGGIEVTGATLNYEVGSITHNRSSGSGAGIYCYRGGSVNASTANSQITDNYAGGSGGAIFLQYGDVKLDGCILNNNESRGSAGAVGIRVGNFVMKGGEIKSNKAGNHGGAVYVTAQNNITPHYDPGNLGCSATISGTDIEGNESAQYGGAVYVLLWEQLVQIL